MLYTAGSETMADELRARTCIELVVNRNKYETDRQAPGFIMISEYNKAIEDCATGVEVCIWAMFAMASVLQRQIQSIYPVMRDQENIVTGTEFANTTLKPISYDEEGQHFEPLCILWTRQETDGPDPWKPTHFVPLIKLTQPGKTDVIIKTQKSYSEYSVNMHPSSSASRLAEEPVPDEPIADSSDERSSLPSSCNNVQQEGAAEIPECWSDAQCEDFKKKNDWLIVRYAKLGCSVCRDVSNLGAHRLSSGLRTHLSEEWVECVVSHYGQTKAAQQSSLRKKICIHRDSDNHMAAVRVLETRRQDKLRASIDVQTSGQHNETCNIFRTAYHIAKSDRPYTDHPKLIELQELNGLNLGRVLHSNVTCSDIIDHIASNMRKALIDKILQQKALISVLIDESTSLGRSTCLIVYLRVTFDEVVGPVTFFLEIVELSATTAEGIEAMLLQCLNVHGITDEFLKDHWLGLGVDGASVMLGNKAGLAVRLRVKFPRIISWHCFNHRLELSVNDAVKSCTESNHFKIFMGALYATYSMSPKCQRELAECAKNLETQITRIGKVLDVRWVASSYRSVKAVWQSYSVLHQHFANKATDSSADGRERAKFAGFAKKLENPVFIRNLGLMHDALEELSDLSLALQRSDITLPVAHRLISRQVEVFHARRDSDSQYYREACESVENGKFKDVVVGAGTGKEKEINRSQFYQSLADSMTARMLPESERALCSSLSVLTPNTWPSDLSPEYGEQDLRIVCTTFMVAFSEVKIDYRTFKDSRGLSVSHKLQSLFNRVNTIPVSTAACERGFSCMNIVCGPLRSRLTVAHMSALMFISLTGPPLMLWKPMPYVKSWLALNRRDATSTQGPQKKQLVSDDPVMCSMWRIL